MKIWLDDIRTPPDKTWKWFKRVVTTKLCIASGNVTEISLDNDLGAYEEEGCKVLDWLEEVFSGVHGTIKLKLPKIHVHTNNPEAAKRMRTVVERLKSLERESNGKDSIVKKGILYRGKFSKKNVLGL